MYLTIFVLVVISLVIYYLIYTVQNGGDTSMWPTGLEDIISCIIKCSKDTGSKKTKTSKKKVTTSKKDTSD